VFLRQKRQRELLGCSLLFPLGSSETLGNEVMRRLCNGRVRDTAALLTQVGRKRGITSSPDPCQCWLVQSTEHDGLSRFVPVACVTKL
jgi:hypothetical protein